MIKVTGKGNISATIVADSIHNDKRITTYELEYPRFIHAEFMTHRLFSRNAASSRAIPVKRSIELIKENTAMPIHWGKNQPGMSAKEECSELVGAGAHVRGATREQAWEVARDFSIRFASDFDRAGYHKQIVNRLLEPFSFIKVVCTATEFDNFFHLRLHKDAQPEIQELARCMWESRAQSKPVELLCGEWHVPYFEDGYWSPELVFEDGSLIYPLRDALVVSASCCAQVSYRRLDDSIEKARSIFERLIESKPAHASPMEHQATPISSESDAGVTHVSVYPNRNYREVWSGNFKGWVQHRQLIPGNVCNSYEG